MLEHALSAQTFDLLTVRVRVEELTAAGLHALLQEFRGSIRHVVTRADDRYFLVVGPKTSGQAIRLDIEQPRATEDSEWHLKPGVIRVAIPDVRQAMLTLVGGKTVDGVVEHFTIEGEDTRQIPFANNREIKPLKRLLGMPVTSVNPHGLGSFESGDVQNWEER